MTISKSSIIYKVMYWFYQEQIPNNLCSFFWTYLFTMGTLPISALGRVLRVDYDSKNLFSQILQNFLLGGILVPSYIGTGFLFFIYIHGREADLIWHYLIWGGLVVIIPTFLFLFIISSYIKAKKDKICPLIEYK